MAVIRLDHVQLAMPAGGEANAVAFYQGLLGIPEVAKPPHLAARGGCWFERGDLKLHLGVDRDFTPARKAHAALLVDDVRSLAEAIAAAGFAVVDDEPLEGYDRVYVDDPFGNRLELMQRLT
jgi:catechol 2,3-dioxygenase-like lactoylglutathione lyase family enzyme